MKLFVLVHLADSDEKKNSRKCEERKESVPNNWWCFFFGLVKCFFWREKGHVRDGKRLDRYGDDDDGVPTSADLLEGLV